MFIKTLAMAKMYDPSGVAPIMRIMFSINM